MVTNTTLSLKYQDSGGDLQGYQVYYRIYPNRTSDFARLVADRDSVNLSPTVNQLVNLGYYQMSQGAAATIVSGSLGSAVSSLTPLLIKAADQATVTLNFSSYEAATVSEPTLQVNGSSNGISNPYLYRSALLFSGNLLESFTSLKGDTSVSNTTQAVDMAGFISPTSNTPYEINVFVVAYGLSATLQAVYSKPVPWGVIRGVP
jgi:hypothetical protein